MQHRCTALWLAAKMFLLWQRRAAANWAKAALFCRERDRSLSTVSSTFTGWLVHADTLLCSNAKFGGQSKHLSTQMFLEGLEVVKDRSIVKSSGSGENITDGQSRQVRGFQSGPQSALGVPSNSASGGSESRLSASSEPSPQEGEHTLGGPNAGPEPPRNNRRSLQILDAVKQTLWPSNLQQGVPVLKDLWDGPEWWSQQGGGNLREMLGGAEGGQRGSLKKSDRKDVAKEGTEGQVNSGLRRGLIEFLDIHKEKMAELEALEALTFNNVDLWSPKSSANVSPEQEQLLAAELEGSKLKLISAFYDLQIVPMRRLFAWAIPTEEALETIMQWSPNGVVEVLVNALCEIPFIGKSSMSKLTLTRQIRLRYPPNLQIGAGTGYWAALLEERGVSVRAFDRTPMHLDHNGHHSVISPAQLKELGERVGISEPLKLGFDVRLTQGLGFGCGEEGGPETAKNYPERSLLLCWPPDETEEDSPDDVKYMGADALTAYTGLTLLYVAEPFGTSFSERTSKTAGPRFEKCLKEGGWKLQKEVQLPHWPQCADRLQVWTRGVKIDNGSGNGSGNNLEQKLGTSLGKREREEYLDALRKLSDRVADNIIRDRLYNEWRVRKVHAPLARAERAILWRHINRRWFLDRAIMSIQFRSVILEREDLV